MAKDKKQVSEEIESSEKTVKVEILKNHPLCGNPVGDICLLPQSFAEMLIKEGFAK